MATYSTTNQESVILFQFKDSAFNNTTFNKTLATVGANEMYELMAMSVIANDGLINQFVLYGDYESVVDFPPDFGGNSGQGINGFVDQYGVGNIATGIIDGELPNMGATGGLVTGFDYVETSDTTLGDQHRYFVRSTGKTVKFYQGSTIKLRYALSAFTPSSQEFLDTNVWLKKTVFAG
tara:strand:+ start:217 stop:753 length:537 start_codon:yes stop_codon:yes gene_type:complete